ncbi:MAG TPA: DNA-processing protein DprA, partial [Gemmatimonadales bacterium]|nr:DNA-processing protein DprA [Gemmatimonadales bacterium]
MADPPDRSRDAVTAYLALAQVPGVGSQRLRLLIGAFGSADAVLQAPHARLATLPGIGKAAATAIRDATPADGERLLGKLDELGARALLPTDPEFPTQLGDLHDPPAVLYAWGDVTLLRRPAVAIVGSRDHTVYGADAARLLAGAVARRAVVVSGMARGIDALAHSAALDAGGASVGVLGNGFGVIYPAANRALYERMVRHGCLVTEHPPGERPHAGSFSRRNRLISGLARAVVVVEAAARSGAITTADAGLEQGRAILAVPGPITSPTSVGCNKLIQQGAHPALCAADIFEQIGLAGGLADTALALATPAPRVPPPDLSGLQLTLWSRLTAEPQHVDALVAHAGTGAAAVLGALTELELRGLVRQAPGMVFGL